MGMKVECARQEFKTVDLFAGPGGLAEGFSAFRGANGKKIFDIALSVEKEPSAFATLRLRSFFRQFAKAPEAYYDYIAGRISKEDLVSAYPEEWQSAELETAMLELGTDEAREEIDERLEDIIAQAGTNTVVIGGPPCQAYSLVGRARNQGIKGYVASEDHRHFLYREYIRILERLRPAAFVMENVKGILSSMIGGEHIIDQVLADLRAAGGIENSYLLVPIVDDDRGRLPGHMIRSENFGIPQCRHRVILAGLRRDIAETWERSGKPLPRLAPAVRQAKVEHVLAGMPALRSGLSKAEDSSSNWRVAAVKAFQIAAGACRRDGNWLNDVTARLLDYAKILDTDGDIPPRSSTRTAPIEDNQLGAWIGDDRLTELPNHASRGHMESDLSRYAFAAAFAEIFGHSPKADEFPSDLAPNHKNWDSGKFSDRFRVQSWGSPSTTVTSHISKDGHYFIHPDPRQCRSLTVREAARLQTFPDNYFFEGNRTQQYVQVGNAVPPLLANQIAEVIADMLGAI